MTTAESDKELPPKIVVCLNCKVHDGLNGPMW